MVLNSGIRDLVAGLKKTANSGLNEAIAAKLHMSLNSGTMPQIAIAGYSGSYSERFKTLGQMQLGSLAVLITQPCPVGCSAIRQVADATLRCIGSE